MARKKRAAARRAFAAAAFVPSNRPTYSRGRYIQPLYQTLHENEAQGDGLLLRCAVLVVLAGFACAFLWFVAGVRELRIEQDFLIAQPRIGWIPVWPEVRVARSELTGLRLEALRGNGRSSGPTTCAIVFSHRGTEHTLLSGLGREQARYILSGPLARVRFSSG